MAVTTTTQIDPTIQPFLSYGLKEAQTLYEKGGPKYYTGQTYVSPSDVTLTGLQALEQRAKTGNPLLDQAQLAISGLIGGTVNPAVAGTQATASGQYLAGNPFFQGAFAPAAQAATQQFQKAISDVSSAASKAGRYGSGAMQNLQGQASNQLAQSLANTAGQLAYQNYAQERGLQEAALGRVGALGQQDIANRMAAVSAAPALANADYQDIQNLLSAGQLREGYTGQQQAADIARFNFLQNAPQQNLATFLSSVYGNPMATLRNQTQSGAADTSTLQNVLGTAATLGGLYKNLGGASGISNLWNSASNWLSGSNAWGNSVYNPYTGSGGWTGSSLANTYYGTGGIGD